MKHFLTFPFVLLIALFDYVSTDPNPRIKLPYGEIEGFHRLSLSNRQFNAFEGVPYANPPTGTFKFKEAIPPKPWPGILKTNTIHKCLQYNHLTPKGQDRVVGDEDCLYLNIYTPTIDLAANLDVIVYIHGGAFMYNYGAMHGPEYILDKDVVYVNFNYRLGPLGFLSTESSLLPGNIGLRDQIVALKWVQNHIHLFGGNPKSVTIIGMSAGGASVHIHYLSPQSKGLFHRGVSQSGTALCPWVLVEKPLEKTMKLIDLVGCNTNTTLEESVACLESRSGRQIVQAVAEFQSWMYNPFSPFGVVVDSWAEEPVLPQHPYELTQKGPLTDAPWIVSFTDSEGLYPGSEFYVDAILKEIDSRWNDVMPFILDYNNTVEPEQLNEVSEKIREHYMGTEPLNKETFREFVQILTDRIFIDSIEDTVRLQVKKQHSPIYMYKFTYRGKYSASSKFTMDNTNLGAAHADDTAYLFKMKMDEWDTAETDEDRQVVNLFVNMIESFATTDKPLVPTIDWSTVGDGTSTLRKLVIADANNLIMEESASPNHEFWDKLPIMENKKLFLKNNRIV